MCPQALAHASRPRPDAPRARAHARAGEVLPGECNAAARGNALGKGPVLFRISGDGVRNIKRLANGGARRLEWPRDWGAWARRPPRPSRRLGPVSPPCTGAAHPWLPITLPAHALTTPCAAAGDERFAQLELDMYRLAGEWAPEDYERQPCVDQLCRRAALLRATAFRPPLSNRAAPSTRAACSPSPTNPPLSTTQCPLPRLQNHPPQRHLHG
jgi:hypothetical protein